MFYKSILIVAVIVIVVVVGGFGYFYFGVYGKIANPAPEKEFTVTKGESGKMIGKNLKDLGLIKDRFLFETEVWLRGSEKEFAAGNYKLPEKASIADLVKILTTAAKREQVKITIPEGLSNKEIAKIWEEKKIGMADDFLAKASVKDSREIIPGSTYDFLALKQKGADLEGYLYPDTYYVFKDSQPEDLIKKMLDNFENKTKDILAEIQSSGKDFHDILTLASIIEREVPKTSERPIIAGLFLKRIQIGMALQSDATVNYATGKYKLQPTYDDLQVNSPYNTYKYRGLPPSPIGNPSISSIKAVLNPEQSEYLYFLSKPTGETVFSKTLEEHNENKAKYLNNP
ncbi:endolytic transglycosylase MltG [Patescibacteria group bacterium]|nr:MAG: endolytic transglycosylase MltG [Patescibacteria group bacterium]